MKILVNIIALLSSVYPMGLAQPDKRTLISGKVTEQSTHEPVEYATVSVISEETGKVITGSLTDSRGEFKIFDIPVGTYRIEIGHISYEKTTLEGITVNVAGQLVLLGSINISPSMLTLEAVTVASDRPVIENKGGKIIYNVSSDITSQGGLAIDVLKKVPQVTVDVDGNVELQGNSNIRFLINGKPSAVFGNNLSDALASIPASQIRTIEAITNPGARYEAQGTGGVINIILEDNKMTGVTGNVNLSAGTRLENGSANLGMKKNNFGVNAFFSGNWRLRSDGAFSNLRETTDTAAGVITSLLQEGSDYFTRNGFRSGAGFEWEISKRDNLTGSLGYNQFNFNSSSLTDQEQLISDLSGRNPIGIFTTRNSDNRRKNSSFDWSLDYRRNFDREKHELGILLSSGYGRPGSSYTQAEYYTGESNPYKGSSSENPGIDNQMELAVDYVLPVNDSLLIETGIKATYQNLTSIADVSVFSPSANEYTIDPLQSYNLKYLKMITAGYFTANFKLFRFLDLKPGLRYEYTFADIKFPNTSVPSYGTLVPSIVISHDFGEKNSLQLSYGRRIERPDYRELNPFINRSDPYNISTGNLFLKPEIGNNIELSFSKGFKKGGNLRLALIERMNSQEIEDVTVFYPEYTIGDSTYANVSVTTVQNIGKEYNSGFSTFISYPVTSKINLRGNVMVFHTYIASNLSEGNLSTGFRTRLNLNATFELPRDLVLELFGFYRSSGRGIQGREPQFFIYNFAFRKRFLNQNASFGFTTTNPFSRSIRQVRTISTENSTSTNMRDLPFRSFGISFSYKFGKMESEKREREIDNGSMMQEINAN